MSRSITLCAADFLIVSRVSAGDHLPGTLHFANVTGECIVQTVPEVASNEKEVEFGDFDKDKDLDGDSSVGASDLLLLLVQWGTDPGGPPDFDGNAMVSASDLLALLTNWGPVPSSNDYVLELLSRTGP